ncbi:MAG: redoxin domain-containing protein, partial [Bdellovibrionales bacterium]|nr:redoxin domain-containing protein [Bdellovibrionales bacterium]
MEKLTIGTTAPVFNLLNQQNSEVNIKAYRGKNILLYFFLKPLSLRCSEQARKIREIKEKMMNDNLVVLGICPDLPKKTLKFFEEENLNFDL